MSEYLIHCCEKRKWYVDEYLVPSMLNQGINEADILIYNDDKKQGNLKSFIESAKLVRGVSGTWHLQDDIIISSDFKKITEEFDRGIVCGFCSYYSEDVPVGIRPARDLWYSFPCIRIPNNILAEFVEWVETPEIKNRYIAYISTNKCDDTLFREFILSEHGDKTIHNLCPNIVDNVDYLLGGSLINNRRNKIESLFFSEKHLIEELKSSLENKVYNNK